MTPITSSNLPPLLAADFLPRLPGDDPLPASTRSWVAGFAFATYGLRLGVRADDPALLPPLAPWLPPLWRPLSGSAPEVDHLFSLTGTGGDDRLALYLDADPVRLDADLAVLATSFDYAVRRCLSERSPNFVFLHAGAVAWRDRAVIIPAESHRGKSTMVAALVRAGAIYYSDEYAVLDPDGLIHPYPKPLGIRPPWDYVPEQVPVEALGGVAGTQPIPLGLVVASEFVPGATWQPRRLTRATGVLQLLGRALSLYRQPEAVFAVLDRATENTVFLAGDRGEAEETAPLILAALDSTEGR